VDLRKTGVYPYAEHPHTGIWCMAWAFDDEEPEIWTPPALPWSDVELGIGMAGLEERIVDHIRSGGEIRAWNAQFERVIWNEIMIKRYRAPFVALEQWVCSAAEAAAMALPRSLDQAAKVVGAKHKKDQEGYNLMMRMTRPRSLQEDGTPIWWDVEDRKQRLYEYCKQDVRTERAIIKALRRLTPHEREVYLLDQRMNDRGFRVDVELVYAAKDVADEGVARANAALSAVTDGEVTEVSNSNRLRAWVQAQGVETDSVAKPAVAELLESDLDPKVREALTLRAAAGKSSLAKLDSMLQVICRDRQARGLLLYHGAGTGRWSGKLLQPQNFARPEIDNVEDFIPDVLARAYDAIDIVAHPITVIVSLLRSMVTAREGHDLMAADYSAIEARVLNWLAGQDDVVESFRAMDAGDKTQHPYKIMAVRMGRGETPADIVKGTEDYQAGKAAELGCGYQMGAKKFVKAAWDVYQVKVTEEQAKVAVDAYRSSHPRVVDLWWETNRACIDAVGEPGVWKIFGARKNLKAIKLGAYLYIVLPSGRPLCYAAPKVVMEPPPWGGEDRPSLHYWGVDGYSKQWGEFRTYGGHLVENIVQAVARDLIADALLRLDGNTPYIPLFSVHDEAICEVKQGEGSIKEFEEIMAALPQWATGLPVAAEAWRGFRYRK
jgi:DNA polymerase